MHVHFNLQADLHEQNKTHVDTNSTYRGTSTHTQDTRMYLNTPAPPQPHPVGPGHPVGLGSSSVSGPCWLKVPPKRLCVCVCVCLSASALSVGLQHVSRAQAREREREGEGEGGGTGGGCGRGAEARREGWGGGGLRCGSHKRPGRNSLGYNGKWADRGLTPANLMRGHIWAASQEKQIRL